MKIKSLHKANKIIKYPGGPFGLAMALQNAPRNRMKFPQGYGDAVQKPSGRWDYEFELEVANESV